MIKSLDYGMIVFHVKDGLVDKMHWQGGPVTRITNEQLMHIMAGGVHVKVSLNELVIGPYLFVIVDRQGAQMTVVRQNSIFDWWLSAKYRLSIWWRNVEQKILMTAHIWGLLHDVVPGQCLSWRQFRRRDAKPR